MARKCCEKTYKNNFKVLWNWEESISVFLITVEKTLIPLWSGLYVFYKIDTMLPITPEEYEEA